MVDSTSSDIVPEDLSITERSRGDRMGGRGKHNRGNPRNPGGKVENREVAVSKALSKLLRHAAGEEGLAINPEGFAQLDQVMQWQRLKSLNITFEDIKIAVTDNAKQRFSMKPNPNLPIVPDPESQEPSDWVIRANQGHTIAIESAAHLDPITIEAGNVPEIVVHGTYYGFYQAILESGGLRKMGRNHIHFSTGLPEHKEGVISGMRSDAEVLIYIDIRRSLSEGGVLWWLSENGVVLTEGDDKGLLATRYWKKVVSRKHDLGVLWEDGELVADLPQKLRSKKAPNGKGSRRGGKSKSKVTPRGKEGHSTFMKEIEAVEREEDTHGL